MKRIISLMAALLLVCAMLTGCMGNSTKEYTCQELTMTVPTYMSDESDDEAFSGMTFALDSFRIAFFGMKEEFSLFEGTVVEDLESYADAVVTGNELDCEIHERAGEDYLYFVYESETEEASYTYLAGAFKSGEAYWLVQIAAETDDYDEEEFLTYLDSVSFS